MLQFNFQSIILLLAIVTTALSAGLFYGWTVSVIPGTLKMSDTSYMETMQIINKEILNPGFFTTFIGAAFCLVLATYFQFKIQTNTKFWITFFALLIYIIGTLLITFFGNVPLNNQLELMELNTMSTDELNLARHTYESSWNRFNAIRTVASFLSFFLLIFAHMQNPSE